MKKLVFKGFLAFITLTFGITYSHAQKRYVDSVFSTLNIKKTADITYGSNTGGVTNTLTMDVYEPNIDVATLRPLIIMAHEGSFLFGAKDDTYMADFAGRMVKRGYVVACITYRKGWAPNANGTAEDNTRRILPAAWRGIQDFRTCVRFFRKNIATGGNTYKVDTKRIIGGGFGAGAYLPINAELIDSPEEFKLASLNRKTDSDPTNDPDTGPYLDTTAVDLGGIYDTRGGSAGYSSRVPLVLIYSGATIDTLLMNTGTNPAAIAAHGDKDETTPYKTAVVNAQLSPGVLIPVVKVHGTYQITRILDQKGANNIFNNINSDGFPQAMIPDNKFGPLNMYKKGLYTFLNQTYMPWDQNQDAYTTTYKFFMDTLVRYTAPRIKVILDNAIADFNASTNTSLTANFTDASVSQLGVIAYKWSFGDGMTDATKNPSHTYATAGSYDVKLVVTNADGQKDSITKTITPGTSSINSKYSTNLFKAYPNPAVDKINLVVNYGESMQSVTMHDMTGKEVYRSTGNVESIDAANLTRGVYSITVKTNSSIGVQRIVLQ